MEIPAEILAGFRCDPEESMARAVICVFQLLPIHLLHFPYSSLSLPLRFYLLMKASVLDAYYGLNVFHNHQCDSICRWGLWMVIRVR